VPSGQSRVRLPAAPLLARVEKRLNRPGWCRLDERAERSDTLQEVLGDVLWRAYYRAKTEDTATLLTIEAFCDRFGWHPYELYGNAYEQAAFKGLPDDFDPWEGVA
jgi:hypothetical protein